MSHKHVLGPLKHGHVLGGRPTRIYRIWMAMRQRCGNPRIKCYRNYGGRGIKVCTRWQIFANFLEDMGIPPADRSIERINNDGNYEPGNCKWATREEQSKNQRRRTMPSHCSKGHMLTPENLYHYVTKRGSRKECLTCKLMRSQKRSLAKKKIRYHQ